MGKSVQNRIVAHQRNIGNGSQAFDHRVIVIKIQAVSSGYSFSLVNIVITIADDLIIIAVQILAKTPVGGWKPPSSLNVVEKGSVQIRLMFCQNPHHIGLCNQKRQVVDVGGVVFLVASPKRYVRKTTPHAILWLRLR